MAPEIQWHWIHWDQLAVHVLIPTEIQEELGQERRTTVLREAEGPAGVAVADAHQKALRAVLDVDEPLGETRMEQAPALLQLLLLVHRRLRPPCWEHKKERPRVFILKKRVETRARFSKRKRSTIT